jgi:hypothetical protein
MRLPLLLSLVVACSSSSAENDQPIDRATFEAALVRVWSGTYATSSGVTVTMRATAAPQPKCGNHILSTKCVTTTQLHLHADAAFSKETVTFTADAAFSKETVTFTGFATAFGAGVEGSNLELKSAAGDSLSCQYQKDLLRDCVLQLHGTVHPKFELRPVTR